MQSILHSLKWFIYRWWLNDYFVSARRQVLCTRNIKSQSYHPSTRLSVLLYYPTFASNVIFALKIFGFPLRIPNSDVGLIEFIKFMVSRLLFFESFKTSLRSFVLNVDFVELLKTFQFFQHMNYSNFSTNLNVGESSIERIIVASSRIFYSKAWTGLAQ